jgi:hypothetical protein
MDGMRKLFQGWKVVIAGASLQFLHAGFNQQSFGAYVALLASERGWSKTSLSGLQRCSPSRRRSWVPWWAG